MAAVDILPAFGYKWAELGTVEALTDAQWKTGWAFIGATPPSVEQFNKWGQIFDEKSNYLYGQLKAIYDDAGLVPAAGTLTTLRDAIAKGRGKLLNVRVFSANAVYTPTPGTAWVVVEAVGGGGSGAGTPPGVGASSIAIGGGGAAGSYGVGVFNSSFAGVNIVVGAGGVGAANSGGAAGGTTSFGALLSAPGGPIGSVAPILTPGSTPTLTGGTNLGAAPTGANVISARGGQGTYGVFLSGPTSYATGPGGASFYGAGAVPVVGGSGSLAGIAASSPGAGGSGALTTGSGPSLAGGNGAAGLVIVREYT